MDNLFFDSGNQVILDFETDNTLHDLTAFDGSSHEILTASQPAGSDGDVLKITKGAVGGAGETWAGTVLTVLEGTDLITPYSSSVTIDVLAPADDIAVLLKLENGSDYEEVEVSTASDGVTEWETLTFDFSSADHNVDYEKATLIFQNGVQGEGEEYYVDNVTFGGFIA